MCTVLYSKCISSTSKKVRYINIQYIPIQYIHMCVLSVRCYKGWCIILTYCKWRMSYEHPTGLTELFNMCFPIGTSDVSNTFQTTSGIFQRFLTCTNKFSCMLLQTQWNLKQYPTCIQDHVFLHIQNFSLDVRYFQSESSSYLSI